jgi:hypothetical protein
MPKREGPYLVDALYEKMADCPYPIATYLIACVLEDVLSGGMSHKMSAAQHETLSRLAIVLSKRDSNVRIERRGRFRRL